MRQGHVVEFKLCGFIFRLRRIHPVSQSAQSLNLSAQCQLYAPEMVSVFSVVAAEAGNLVGPSAQNLANLLALTLRKFVHRLFLRINSAA